MSALPPKADITEDRRHVRFVPKAEVAEVSYDSTPLVTGGTPKAGATSNNHLPGTGELIRAFSREDAAQLRSNGCREWAHVLVTQGRRNCPRWKYRNSNLRRLVRHQH